MSPLLFRCKKLFRPDRRIPFFIGVFFIGCLLFFFAVCRGPGAEWKDAVTLLVLFAGYGAAFSVMLFQPDPRRFAAWGLFPLLVIAAEMINFQLRSRFAVNPLCRYAITLFFSLLLIHIGLECLGGIARKRIFPALAGALLQTLAEAPFLALLCRNLLERAPVESETVSAILQTDRREAFFYVLNHRGVWGIVILLILVFVLQLVWLLRQKNWKISGNRYAHVMTAVLSAGLILTGTMGGIRLYRKGKLPSFALLRAGAAYREELAAFNRRREALRHAALPPAQQALIRTTGFDGNFLLVIGESHTRDHMSCYGYGKNTTPFLNRCRSDRSFTFLDGYSCHVHTTESLRMVLTEENQYRKKRRALSDCTTLLDVLRHCCCRIEVFSNQFPYTAADSPVSAVFSAADRLVFLKASYYTKLSEELLDDRLLVLLARQKKEKRRLTVLHLMGAHAPYLLRYPDGFAAELSLHYDRAMRFTDQLLERILQISDPDVLLFVSDHGEDVALEEHDSAMFTPAMTHIPVVIYLNPRYAAMHPELAAGLKNAEKKIFTNDLVFDFLLDLMGIETDFNPASLHLLSPQYRIDRDSARTMKGRRHINGMPVK